MDQKVRRGAASLNRCTVLYLLLSRKVLNHVAGECVTAHADMLACSGLVEQHFLQDGLAPGLGHVGGNHVDIALLQMAVTVPVPVKHRPNKAEAMEATKQNTGQRCIAT